MKKLIYVIGLIAPIFFLSCKSEHKKHEEKTNFLVTTPLLKDTSIVNEYVCQIRSFQHIELRALEKGYLEKIYVDEGKFVKQGQLMFQIMPMLYQAELKKAQAEVNYAQIEYTNTKTLADSNIVSPNELALTKAKLEKAQAELDMAKTHLSFTEIRAPFDGIMDRFHVRLGSLLDEGELLTSLSDNSKIWVYFNVPEAEYLDFKMRVKKDSLIKVNLLMANNQLFDQDGLVETIEADFDNETGNIAFRATFPNPSRLLRHGETGNILMKVPISKALLIPQKATFQILDKKYVFVIDKDGVAHQRQISIAAELEDLFVIENGLDLNETILLEGLRKVEDGKKITPEMVNPAEVISHLKLYAE